MASMAESADRTTVTSTTGMRASIWRSCRKTSRPDWSGRRRSSRITSGPGDLATVRDALHDQDALHLREVAHKFYGMLSAFSTAAGDQAADLEDLAARGLLKEAPVVVEQLDRCATELARLAGGLTVETLRKQAEATDNPNRAAGP